MHRRSKVAAAVVFGTALISPVAAVAPVSAATGYVAFGTLLGGHDRIDHPASNECLGIPIAATEISNDTASVMSVYADPACLVKIATVDPFSNTGSLSVIGSFKLT